MFDEVALSEGVSKERNALLVLSTLPLTPLVRDMSIVQPLQFTEIPPNNFFDSPYREGGARYNLNAKIDTKRLTLDYSHLKILQDYARQFEGAMATIKEGKLYRVRETPLNSSNYSILSGRKIFDNGTIIPLIEQYVAETLLGTNQTKSEKEKGKIDLRR